MEEPIISLRRAAMTYQAADGEVEALRDVSFDVQEGEFLSIVGPSGCGKSTLLGAISGLERLSAGTVTLCGQTVNGISPEIGLMPQQDQLFEWQTIYANVTLGLRIQGLYDESHRRRVEELLERYELVSFSRKRPGQLSGGMRQCCALIRTLATDPKILLLDEPFSALDYQTRLQVSGDIWRIIREQDKTALLVTHDIAEAVSLSDRIVVLSRRPAVLKMILDLSQWTAKTPMERREDPMFSHYFDLIWKELELHE